MAWRSLELACRGVPRYVLPGKPVGNALHGFFERGKISRVGESQIAVAEGTEAGARHRRDAGLVQEPRLQGPGGKTGTLDIRECIEGAARIGAAEAVQNVEGGNDIGAALGEGRDHALNWLARTRKSCDSSI